MPYFILFLFYTGLIIAGAKAKQNTQKWYARMMHITGIIALISYILAAQVLNGGNSEAAILGGICALACFCCTILYFIALLFYSLKTYAIAKTNKQLDYLNFQLQDQLEIREKSSNQK